MQDFLASHAKILVILAFVKNSFVKDFSWISFHDLEKPCHDELPRFWQEISKIQDFSWQENQDAKHWVTINSQLIPQLLITTDFLSFTVSILVFRNPIPCDHLCIPIDLPPLLILLPGIATLNSQNAIPKFSVTVHSPVLFVSRCKSN